MKKFKLVKVILLIFCLIIGNTANVSAATKVLNVKVNAVTVKINNKAVKVDNFEYSGKNYVQPQDVCSYFGIEYIYTAKSKSITINDKKPVNPVTTAKSLFGAFKLETPKSINASPNGLTIKINDKAVKIDNYIYNGSAYLDLKQLAVSLGKDYIADTKSKTISINDKKPSNPVIKLNTEIITDADITVTIDNWGNAVTREYKVDEGSWQMYKAPVVMSKNGVIYARGKNAAGVESDVVSSKITNIRKILTKQQVSKNNVSVVKVIEYNTNNDVIGTGSGFIISSDGKVVTNYHVINLSTKLEVKTFDDKTFKVKGVLSYNVKKDLAILMLEDANSLPIVPLGNSDKISVGEDVVAIGYPLGLQNTVSFGNISSISPAISREGYKDILITAPISSGSSGGALLNMYGEIIGVTFATTTKGQNMNYAIPVNDLKPMLGSNKLISLVDVIKEVYPVMPYQTFADYIAYCYSEYTVNNNNITFNYVFIEDDSKKANTIDVSIHLYDGDFRLMMDKLNENKKKDVEVWINNILNEVKLYYPEKDCLLIVYLYDEYGARPSDFLADEIEYDSSIGKYTVTSLVIKSEFVSGVNSITWYWE